MPRTVGQGGTIRLPGEYRDGAGALVDPVDPLVAITNPSGGVVAGAVVPVRDSLGRYHVDHVAATDAPIGVWTARWTGTINGVPVTAEDRFEVFAAGAIRFGPPWEPTPSEVHGIIPQRTNGKPFTDDTVPTVAQVTTIISDVMSEVDSWLEHTVVPEQHVDLARFVVKLGAAKEIERAFWPEQGQAPSGSSYVQLKQRYEETLAQLVLAVLGIVVNPGAPGSGTGDDAADGLYSVEIRSGNVPREQLGTEVLP